MGAFRRLAVGTGAILAVSAALAVPVAPAGASQSAATHRPFIGRSVGPAVARGLGLTHSTSSNWAGYAAYNSTFTSVSASWVQRAVTCTSQTTYSSFWVGLDGYNSNSVEQTGTEADCYRGVAYYSSWYEMYPAYPVNYSNTVAPGDSFTASVTYTSGHFVLVLTNNTRGWSHTTTASYSAAARSSAEVIAEAPSSGTGVLPLSNFGTAGFTSARANGSAIGSFTTDAITMASGSTTKATTSALSASTNFSVTWHHV